MKISHVDGGVLGLFTATVTHFGAVRLQENRIQAGASLKTKETKEINYSV